MNKIEQLIACGDISPEDLVKAEDLIERAKLVQKALNACKQTISFPLGKKQVQCYLKKCHKEDNESYNVWGEYKCQYKKEQKIKNKNVQK